MFTYVRPMKNQSLFFFSEINKVDNVKDEKLSPRISISVQLARHDISPFQIIMIRNLPSGALGQPQTCTDYNMIISISKHICNNAMHNAHKQ